MKTMKTTKHRWFMSKKQRQVKSKEVLDRLVDKSKPVYDTMVSGSVITTGGFSTISTGQAITWGSIPQVMGVAAWNALNGRNGQLAISPTETVTVTVTEIKPEDTIKDQQVILEEGKITLKMENG